MIFMSVAEIAAATGGAPLGVDNSQLDTLGVTFATTDSREVVPGTLFVAKPGEVTDGHKFVPVAFESGASLALVEREVRAESGELYPSVLVDDVVLAMGKLATAVIAKIRAVRAERGEEPLRVFGITGSAGKTTTKDALAAMLRGSGETVAPVGSYNSEVGVPLTVFRADENTRFLVIEMGADRVGNIRYLADMTGPDFGAVLKVGTAHAGEFGGVDNIERTKGELVEGVSSAIVLNADDERVLRMSSRASVPVQYFSASEPEEADRERTLAALNLRANEQGCPEFTLRVPASLNPAGVQEEYEISARLIGEHHVYNLLAAASLALLAGVSAASIAESMNSVGAVSKWRMARTDREDGVSVINDAYNANPESMVAALQTLAQLGRGVPARRTWAVLGAMLELGDASVEEHDRIGRFVVRMNISKLIAVGDIAKPIYNAAHLEGSWGNEATWVETTEEAAQILRAELAPGDIVLFKSSNGARLGPLGDEIAFAPEAYGRAEDQAPTWLSAGDFVELTDMTKIFEQHNEEGAR
ncbi:MAG: UDP-N-acetylmuramoyl-tripeptide--D-alanyl-D-alanine ligase [Rothia sp. (in: high G+C Gram-positive bacteria)]|uniref:UDP-N-acetylmuramoyl-tripeptide--D-alanyl-D- alanine ligase n=1 Tax=Rothia sp. (in: high G+C Gram-positive bacteria) TaxID=1885016 RepID=UPI0026E0D7D7|nr:UDP-N-acetylmuramoyl-tripeptide--D-alanyl-D-alanine ligase [Rothia sp. (in: high G+C Gram-positive bacteria)]MDO5751094.1 UDP-N-acetylmuramoyl-tripeptide--D-alanyl-D-alanine ligase [Rothia sp. (in: high G+C Gram-positive bacteria)]